MNQGTAHPAQLYQTHPAQLYQAHTYRMQKICEIQQEIECEREKRAVLSKKYHRGVKLITIIDDSLVFATMGFGAAGIGVLSTIVATPIAIAMEASVIAAGLLSIVGGYVNKKLAMKAEKHEKIKTLADAKLNTISDYVSRALKDDIVSDEEYSLILSELESFNGMKEEIRSKIKGREETFKSFRRKLEKSNIQHG